MATSHSTASPRCVCSRVRPRRGAWSRFGNDGFAELVAKSPERFVGYAASLPMNAPEAVAKEAEAVLSNGANAVQLHANVDGAPMDKDQFLPIYEIIEGSGKPILL